MLAVGVLGLTIAVTWWATRPRWVPLTHAADHEQARRVVEELRESGFRVRVEDTTVAVPASQRHEARLLAFGSAGSANLLGEQPGTGSMVIPGRPAVTHDQQRMHRQVATGSDLARTLSHMNGIRRAGVQLVLPDRSWFTEHDVTARASVTLELEPGGSLSGIQAKTVANVVAGAVPQLDPADVVVADTDGRLYSRPVDDDTPAAALDRLLTQQWETETRLEADLQELLDERYGPGGSTVQVAVRLDPSTEEILRTEFDGTRAAARSLVTQVEERNEGSAHAGGVPGTAQVLPEIGARTDSADGAGRMERSFTDEKLEIPNETTLLVAPAGRLDQLTVAVLVDGERTRDPVSGESVFVPRSEEELGQIRALVARTVGLTGDGDDRISVVCMPLARTPDAPLTASAGLLGRVDWGHLAPSAVLALFILLAFRHVVRPVLRASLPPHAPGPVAGILGIPADDRSPGFRQRLSELTGRPSGGGDPLAGALEENLDAAGRTLGDWIGRRRARRYQAPRE